MGSCKQKAKSLSELDEEQNLKACGFQAFCALLLRRVKRGTTGQRLKDLHRLVGACVVPLVAVCAGRAIPITLELASSTELASHRSSSRGARKVLLLQVKL